MYDTILEILVNKYIHSNDIESMKNLYQSARLLRQRIEQFTKTVKTSSSIIVTSTLEDVPVEPYTTIRWIMAGSADKLQTEVRTSIVDRGALNLSQNLMFGFKSKRQVTYKPSDAGAGFRSQQARENPPSTGIGPDHPPRHKKQETCESPQRTGSLCVLQPCPHHGNSPYQCCSGEYKAVPGAVCATFLEEGHVCVLSLRQHRQHSLCLGHCWWQGYNTWDSHCHLPEG